MVIKGKIRNEWVESMLESGLMPQETPEALRELVLEAVEKIKKGKVEPKETIALTLVKGKDELPVRQKL